MFYISLDFPYGNEWPSVIACFFRTKPDLLPHYMNMSLWMRSICSFSKNKFFEYNFSLSLCVSSQCAHPHASTAPALKTTSAATTSVWVAAWSPTLQANAWPAATTCTITSALTSAHLVSTPLRAGAASASAFARSSTTSASRAKVTATNTSSTTAPASQSALLGTPLWTPLRK